MNIFPLFFAAAEIGIGRGSFYFATTKIRIGRGPFYFATTKIGIGRGSLLRLVGCGRDRCHSGGFLLRIMPPSSHPFPACAPRLYCKRAILLAGTIALHRFLISGPDLRINAAKRSKQGQFVQ